MNCPICGADMYDSVCFQCLEHERKHYEDQRWQENYDREMEELAYQEHMEEDRRSNA